METEVFETFVVDYDAFGAVSVRVGEQVFLYRRLQDAYDKTLVAVINEMNELLGYLNREDAAHRVLPALKEGVRFQCVVSGEPDGGKVPLQIRPVAQSEVAGIISRQGSKRARTAGFPPLAGIFNDEEAEPEFEVDEEEVVEIEEELEEEFDDEDETVPEEE